MFTHGALSTNFETSNTISRYFKTIKNEISCIRFFTRKRSEVNKALLGTRINSIKLVIAQLHAMKKLHLNILVEHARVSQLLQIEVPMTHSRLPHHRNANAFQRRRQTFTLPSNQLCNGLQLIRALAHSSKRMRREEFPTVLFVQA